jgi:hypothetical protein
MDATRTTPNQNNPQPLLRVTVHGRQNRRVDQ